jgi:hypothetical protein
MERMEGREFSGGKGRSWGWSQWVDATLNSDPHSMKTKAKSAGLGLDQPEPN